jgi:UDP-N-acetylmuramyl pentapeptide synthase
MTPLKLTDGHPPLRKCHSRSLLPGQWFVALDGYNFDGYAFVEDAAR